MPAKDPGAVDLPSDKGANWFFTTREGFAGKPGQPIFVSKATGATWSVGRRKVTDAQEYLRFLRTR